MIGWAAHEIATIDSEPTVGIEGSVGQSLASASATTPVFSAWAYLLAQLRFHPWRRDQDLVVSTPPPGLFSP